MTNWKEEAERAKENLEKRSFIVEMDRELPENSSLRVIQKLDSGNGKLKYKVVTEKSEDYWY
jgi:hypothetical protein